MFKQHLQGLDKDQKFGSAADESLQCLTLLVRVLSLTSEDLSAIETVSVLNTL